MRKYRNFLLSKPILRLVTLIGVTVSLLAIAASRLPTGMGVFWDPLTLFVGLCALAGSFLAFYWGKRSSLFAFGSCSLGLCICFAWLAFLFRSVLPLLPTFLWLILGFFALICAKKEQDSS